MKIARSKLRVELTVTEHGVKQSVRDVFVKATEKRCTTSEQDALVVYRSIELVLLVVQQTGVFNLSVKLFN